MWMDEMYRMADRANEKRDSMYTNCQDRVNSHRCPAVYVCFLSFIGPESTLYFQSFGAESYHVAASCRTFDKPYLCPTSASKQQAVQTTS